MKETLQTLGRDCKWYNVTIKAFKYNLRALYSSNVKNEKLLQEHMCLLNEKWDRTKSRRKKIDKIKRSIMEYIQYR